MVLALVATVAVLAFASLCLILARGLKASAKRGFTLAALAGFVHLTANLFTVAGDVGLVASDTPPLIFATIQAAFFVMPALAVRSFFRTWYGAFRKVAGTTFGPYPCRKLLQIPKKGKSTTVIPI